LAAGNINHAGLGIRPGRRSLKPFFIPGCDRLAAALDPVFCRLMRSAAGRGIDQFFSALALSRLTLALQQELHRILRRHDARHALGPAGAGKKPTLTSGARDGSSDFRRDAVVADNVSSKAPPSASPLMAAAQGLPEVSMARNTSEDLRLSSNSIWWLQLRPWPEQFGVSRFMAPSHRQVGAAGGLLAEVTTTPLTAASAGSASRSLRVR